MQTAECVRPNRAGGQIAGGTTGSASIAGGFPLRFSDPASLANQQAPWYRSLDAYQYKPAFQGVRFKLEAKHRPAIHECLTYGLMRGDIGDADLSVLCEGDQLNDEAALALSSRVMGGIGDRLECYRQSLAEKLKAEAVAVAQEVDMAELLDWQLDCWQPTLSLNYFEEDFGDYGMMADTMALRLHREHFLSFVEFDIWDLPTPLQPLMILAVNVFSELSDKPIGLIGHDECWFSDNYDYWYDIACDEFKHLQEKGGEGIPNLLVAFLSEQLPDFLEEMNEGVGLHYCEDSFPDVLFGEMLTRQRKQRWTDVVCGLSLCQSMTLIKDTLKNWADLQNPILGHPIARRLAFLADLYLSEPEATKLAETPQSRDFDGDVGFNCTAAVSTGDGQEHVNLIMIGDYAAEGEYTKEVKGLRFDEKLEPYMQRMLFGDFLLMSLRGAYEC